MSVFMGLPFFLFCYAAGLGCAPSIDFRTSYAAIPFLIAPLWFLTRKKPFSVLAAALFFWTLGVSLYHLELTPPHTPGNIRSFVSNSTVAVEGDVLSVSRRPHNGSLLDLNARSVTSNGIATPVKGKVRLYIESGFPQTHPGDRIRFLSRLRSPRLFGTPGEFNFPRHLAFHDIFTTAYVRNAQEVVSFAQNDNLGFASFFSRKRVDIGHIIDRSVSPEISSLVRALVIGDKGGILPEQRDLLARGGVSHIFAISGFHLGLIAAFLYASGLFLYRQSETLLLYGPPRRYLPVALVPPLLAYVMITGNALPTRRAFYMIMAAALLFFSSRRTPSLKLLAAAAFSILFLEPLAFFEPSFQLSFAGVLGIMVLAPRWGKNLPKGPKFLRWAITLALATFAATVTTTPLVLMHFHMLAPAGLLTNLFAIPLIGFIAVPAGLLGAVFSTFWTAGAELLFQGCGLAIELALFLVEWVIKIPLLDGWKLYLSPQQIIAAFALSSTFILPIQSFPKGLIKVGLAMAGILLMLWHPPQPRGLSSTAISVGQGESILLSRNGKHYLVDGGGLRSETFDVGERLLAPFLGHAGVQSLEAVVLTHDHPDHFTGLVYVLEHFPAKNFWSSTPFKKLDETLKEVLLRKKIPLTEFTTGWTLHEEGGENSLALFVTPEAGKNINNNSLVILAVHGKDAVLLTGDLEAEGVNKLLASGLPCRANLLKLPHHGSRKSSPEILLEKIRPEAAFASAGFNNRYKFPHRKTVETFHRQQVPLYRTDLQGTVHFYTHGNGWQVKLLSKEH